MDFYYAGWSFMRQNAKTYVKFSILLCTNTQQPEWVSVRVCRNTGGGSNDGINAKKAES